MPAPFDGIETYRKASQSRISKGIAAFFVPAWYRYVSGRTINDDGICDGICYPLMVSMPLNDQKVRNAKPAGKPYKLADEKGLYLLVQSTGAKLWRFNYRHEGKQKTLALGGYPDTALATARKELAKAREGLAAGIDPSADKQQQKRTKRNAAANSFEAVAREWLAKQTLKPVTRTKALWMFEAMTFPWIGSLPVSAITAPEVLAMLRRIESRGKLETAQRVKQQCGRVFRYAVATGLAERDPTGDLRGAIATPKTRHRAAITDPAQVGPLMRAIEGFSGSFVVAAALKLAPLVFVRPGELRKAEWAEIDLDAAQWRIPGDKMKMGAAHIVPLAAQAVAVLREIQALTGTGRYVFPGARSTRQPMSEAAVVAALRRMGYGGEEMSGHGFRAMARTLLAEMGWLPDMIERQLAHKASGPLGAAYDRAQFLAERKKMMQAWADYLDGARRGNVVPLKRAKG